MARAMGGQPPLDSRRAQKRINPPRPPESMAKGMVRPAGLTCMIEQRANRLHVLLSAGLYVFFALFLIWPIAQVVATGFRNKTGGFTFDYVRLIFADPALVRGLVRSEER